MFLSNLQIEMKALEWLADHIGWATDEQKAKVELLQAQKKKLEVESVQEDDEGVVIINDIK